MVFEPHVGGHIIDRGADGSECRWARVLAYEPPHRVCFSWDINLRWQLETDPAKTSEIEVTFTPDGPGTHPGWYSPTATSTATATAGRACATRLAQAGASAASPKSPHNAFDTRRRQPPDPAGLPLHHPAVCALPPERTSYEPRPGH